MDIKEIIEWFKAAKPKPTEKDKSTQIGCHLEKVSEMLQALSCVKEQVDDVSREFYSSAAIDKTIDGEDVELPENWQIELLDALCDQIVTAIGVGYMMGFNMAGALDEWSKFKDGCFKPDLAKFLKAGENE